MDIDSLYLALLKENLEGVVLPKKRDKWNAMQQGDCTNTSTADATDNFSSECAATHIKNAIRGNQVSLRKNLDVQKCCVQAIEGFIRMIESAIGTKSAANF